MQPWNLTPKSRHSQHPKKSPSFPLLRDNTIVTYIIITQFLQFHDWLWPYGLAFFPFLKSLGISEKFKIEGPEVLFRVLVLLAVPYSFSLTEPFVHSWNSLRARIVFNPFNFFPQIYPIPKSEGFLKTRNWPKHQ